MSELLNEQAGGGLEGEPQAFMPSQAAIEENQENLARAAKDMRVYDRDSRPVAQASFNALMSELDCANAMREALKVIGCRAIPTGSAKNCKCVVHEALRGVVAPAPASVAPVGEQQPWAHRAAAKSIAAHLQATTSRSLTAGLTYTIESILVAYFPRVALPKAERPRIVCLCGSTKFMEAFQTANLAETLAGNIVLSVGTNTRSDAQLTRENYFQDPTIKERLDALHFRKIEMADEVLVLDVGGYIGESTRNEINHATAFGKPLRFWSNEHAGAGRGDNHVAPESSLRPDNASAEVAAEFDRMIARATTGYAEGFAEGVEAVANIAEIRAINHQVAFKCSNEMRYFTDYQEATDIAKEARSLRPNAQTGPIGAFTGHSLDCASLHGYSCTCDAQTVGQPEVE